MYSRILFNIFAVFLLALFQLSFIGNLPFGLDRINLALLVLLFILILNGFKAALWWAVGMGFIFDLYSFVPFGFYLIIFLATIVCADLLLVNFFTNRSLYSFLALTILSLFIFVFFLELGFYIMKFFIVAENNLFFHQDFWHNILVTGIYNLCVATLSFYFLNFISLKIQPFFLTKK